MANRVRSVDNRADRLGNSGGNPGRSVSSGDRCQSWRDCGTGESGPSDSRLLRGPAPPDQPSTFVSRLALRFDEMNVALSAVFLLPLVLYTIGALLVSFFMGFGFRKGWDFAGRWPRQRP